jgi:NAD(P)-dependent dehydrogenase (short-subunit alcohol dehydrogenase family)
LPRLRAVGGGSIVTSPRPQAARATEPLRVCGREGRNHLFSRQFALDAAADNVRVNVIAPGSVRTPMTAPVYAEAGVEEWTADRPVLDPGAARRARGDRLRDLLPPLG